MCPGGISEQEPLRPSSQMEVAASSLADGDGILVAEMVKAGLWAVSLLCALASIFMRTREGFLFLLRVNDVKLSGRPSEPQLELLQNIDQDKKKQVGRETGLLPLRPTYDVIMSGDLLKQRDTKRWSWACRYFVLSSNRKLYFYQDKQHHIPKGCIDLDRCTVELKSSKSIFVRLGLKGLGIWGGQLEGGRVLRLYDAVSGDVIMSLSCVDSASKYLEQWEKLLKAYGAH